MPAHSHPTTAPFQSWRRPAPQTPRILPADTGKSLCDAVPADDQASAGTVSPAASFFLPSQLLTVEVLRRPVESTLPGISLATLMFECSDPAATGSRIPSRDISRPSEVALCAGDGPCGSEPTIALPWRVTAALDSDIRLTAGQDLGSLRFESHTVSPSATAISCRRPLPSHVATCTASTLLIAGPEAGRHHTGVAGCGRTTVS